MLTLHPNFSYRVDVIGNERQKVLVIDNFLQNPEWLVDYCVENNSFEPVSAMYPGVRMQAPNEYFAALTQYLKPIILDVFELDEGKIKNIFSAFAMVMTPPDQLKPEQVIPHFDSNHAADLASVYYLCGEQFGGTSLYRHIPTGYEYVDSTRLADYMTSLRRSFQEGDIERRYMDGTNKVFERMVAYKAKFNRFIMYRCTSLHSGDIGEGFKFIDDPTSGRLTLTTFIGSN